MWHFSPLAVLWEDICSTGSSCFVAELHLCCWTTHSSRIELISGVKNLSFDSPSEVLAAWKMSASHLCVHCTPFHWAAMLHFVNARRKLLTWTNANNKILTAVSFRMLSPSPAGSPSGSGTHRWADVELGCDWTWTGSEWGFSCELVFVLRDWSWVWSSVLGWKSCVSVAGWGTIFGDKVPSVTSNKESRSISKSTVLAAWIRAWSLMDPIKLRSGSVSPEPPPPAASAGHRGIVGTPMIAAALCDFSTFCRSFSFSLWNFFNMLVTLNVPTDFFFFFFISPSGPIADKVLQDEQIKRMRDLEID